MLHFPFPRRPCAPLPLLRGIVPYFPAGEKSGKKKRRPEMRRSAGRRRDLQLCRGLCGSGGGSAEAHKQRGAHRERHQRDGKDDHHKAGGSAGHCAGAFAGFKAEQREQQKKNAAARQAGKTGDKADAREERGLAAHAIAGRAAGCAQSTSGPAKVPATPARCASI